MTPEITALNPSSETLTVRWDGKIYCLRQDVVIAFGVTTALAMAEPVEPEFDNH